MKKEKLVKNLLFAVFGLIVGLGFQVLWDRITPEVAEDYLYDDLEKISEARQKTKGKVAYDYYATNFEIDSNTLYSFIKKITEKKPSGFLFIMYKMSFRNDKYNKFSFTFSSSGSDKKHEPIMGIIDIPIDNLNKSSDPKYYSDAFNEVKEKNTFFNKIKGHNHEYDNGITFPIEQVKAFLDSNKTDTYYFYPALAPILKNGKETKNSFTTILISGDKELRQKGAKLGGAKDGNNFYGDKGTACCQ